MREPCILLSKDDGWPRPGVAGSPPPHRWPGTHGMCAGRVFEQPFFTGLTSLPGVAMSFCDHSAQRLGVKTEGTPKTVTRGSQYNNAVMAHNADKVIVL